MSKNLPIHWFKTMNKENRPLVTDKPVEAQDFTKTTHHFKEIYEIYLELVKKQRTIAPCNRLDLDTQGV